MASIPQAMTDEQRRSVALDYLRALDGGGVTPDGRGIMDLFADDALVYFPKWGVATGKEQIGRLFGDLGGILRSIAHDYDAINWILTAGDTLACEGTSDGEHRDGPWRGSRWCDVFEIRDGLIRRCFIYLDPDYAGRDTARYPWLDRS
jgi:hypothetical protein